ncbi:DUF4259 domain-containing protein [Streptomyces cynarae]|uniref:DUF4259 domain-containing protein n=1 Tax=Streptomyces cynarae TaxID=2981134 RepID=UPI0036F1B53A
MGTWGTGPFDSDLAADFVDELEGLTHQQVIDVLERAFQRVTDSGERVDGGDGVEAVAAGALVASTLPDSPIVLDPDDGPREPLPELPASLGASARLALDPGSPGRIRNGNRLGGQRRRRPVAPGSATDTRSTRNTH